MRYNLCPGIFLKLYILPTYPENFMLVSRSEIFWHYMTRSDCTIGTKQFSNNNNLFIIIGRDRRMTIQNNMKL